MIISILTLTSFDSKWTIISSIANERIESLLENPNLSICAVILNVIVIENYVISFEEHF